MIWNFNYDWHTLASQRRLVSVHLLLLLLLRIFFLSPLHFVTTTIQRLPLLLLLLVGVSPVPCQGIRLSYALDANVDGCLKDVSIVAVVS